MLRARERDESGVPAWALPNAAPEGGPVARAVWRACIVELLALKPGSVGVHGGGHGMRVEDFARSAAVAAPALGAVAMPVGRRVRDAVTATRAAVGCNTNLGIALLCAPLCRAADLATGSLESRLAQTLAELNLEDTRLVFEAIRTASPAGLGESARHDVRGEPCADLGTVMREAAGRDRIAYQYANGFADVFELGLPVVGESLDGERPDAVPELAGARAAERVYLHFLARLTDTHIERKHGADAAREVRERAAAIEKSIGGGLGSREAAGLLLDFDRSLKARSINPGTSADLSVAAVLAHGLRA